jgi:hypothetical protein
MPARKLQPVLLAPVKKFGSHLRHFQAARVCHHRVLDGDNAVKFTAKVHVRLLEMRDREGQKGADSVPTSQPLQRIYVHGLLLNRKIAPGGQLGLAHHRQGASPTSRLGGRIALNAPLDGPG